MTHQCMDQSREQRYRREERHFCLSLRRSSAFDGTGVAELLHTAALNIIGGAISATIKTFPFRWRR